MPPKIISKKKDPVVEFRNVTRSYGSPGDGGLLIRALDGVDFKVYEGEYVAITGPSGSGKSTLLHLIGLLDRQSDGEIYVNGVETSKLSDSDLARLRNKTIGFVFQQFNLLKKTSALKNVELPLIYAGVTSKDRQEQAKQELIKVGLGDRLQNGPSQLSGGQQQRVAIARALVTNPAMLLADEPTGNLDSKTGEQILQLFEQLYEKGMTIVMVTHDADIAARAKRQIIIRDGKIVSDR